MAEDHVLQPFDCGNDILSDWLRRRAMKNQHINASRTFVICLEGTKRVVGYYSIATGSVGHADLGRSLRQNMPDPVPVILLGRLAVDVCTQGHSLG
ncbi:GNAT family N-acetyltransferase, partial [Yersinia enterocolitica]